MGEFFSLNSGFKTFLNISFHLKRTAYMLYSILKPQAKADKRTTASAISKVFSFTKILKYQIN